jgi:hypothetical protein
MYTVKDAHGLVAYEDRDEATALYVAVRRVTLKGIDHTVVADDGAVQWYAEVDTKVSDEPTYPCIVHWRGEDA